MCIPDPRPYMSETEPEEPDVEETRAEGGWCPVFPELE